MKAFSRQARFVLLPIGIVIGVALAFGLTSLAEDSELDSEPRVFPYNGVLELDGAGFTGQADFQFSLTDEGDCNFSEDHDAVTVSGGRFSVNIGGIDPDSNTLPNCVFDAERMFIQIAVRESGDNQPHRALSGRQRIHPVPFAYWAAEGSDFRIDGNLRADSANINGNVSAGSVNVNGHTSTNTLNAGTTNLGTTVINANDFIFGNNNERGDGGRALVHFFDDALHLNFDGDFSGGTTIGSNLDVQGNLSLTGTIRDTNSDVVITDGLVVEDRFRPRDTIEDDRGDVTVNDNLDITGELNVDGVVITPEIRADNQLVVPGTHGVNNSVEDYNVIRAVGTGRSSSTHFCALTKVRISDDDGEDDTTECRAFVQGGEWNIMIRTNANEGVVNSECEVTCFRFR